MIGITSYGAYVPFARLAREAIGPGLRGEKALANFDEDSITLAVAAATDCLNGIERKDVDGLMFASTTSPYTEKQASTMIAAALDLRSDATLADFANTMRGSTVAMKAAMDAVKAGSAKKVLVTAADCRMGNPGSSTEQNSGDGAGAVVIGDTDVAVSIEAVHSASDEIMDTWRDEG
ncbi:3-hydroxy-3-methylglutaryl CoA synthase, partial [Chloroflexota bacterium]